LAKLGNTKEIKLCFNEMKLPLKGYKKKSNKRV